MGIDVLQSSYPYLYQIQSVQDRYDVNAIQRCIQEWKDTTLKTAQEINLNRGITATTWARFQCYSLIHARELEDHEIKFGIVLSIGRNIAQCYVRTRVNETFTEDPENGENGLQQAINRLEREIGNINSNPNERSRMENCYQSCLQLQRYGNAEMHFRNYQTNADSLFRTNIGGRENALMMCMNASSQLASQLAPNTIEVNEWMDYSRLAPYNQYQRELQKKEEEYQQNLKLLRSSSETEIQNALTARETQLKESHEIEIKELENKYLEEIEELKKETGYSEQELQDKIDEVNRMHFGNITKMNQDFEARLREAVSEERNRLEVENKQRLDDEEQRLQREHQDEIDRLNHEAKESEQKIRDHYEQVRQDEIKKQRGRNRWRTFWFIVCAIVAAAAIRYVVWINEVKVSYDVQTKGTQQNQGIGTDETNVSVVQNGDVLEVKTDSDEMDVRQITIEFNQSHKTAKEEYTKTLNIKLDNEIEELKEGDNSFIIKVDGFVRKTIPLVNIVARESNSDPQSSDEFYFTLADGTDDAASFKIWAEQGDLQYVPWTEWNVSSGDVIRICGASQETEVQHMVSLFNYERDENTIETEGSEIQIEIPKQESGSLLAVNVRAQGVNEDSESVLSGWENFYFRIVDPGLRCFLYYENEKIPEHGIVKLSAERTVLVEGSSENANMTIQYAWDMDPWESIQSNQATISIPDTVLDGEAHYLYITSYDGDTYLGANQVYKFIEE